MNKILNNFLAILFAVVCCFIYLGGFYFMIKLVVGIFTGISFISIIDMFLTSQALLSLASIIVWLLLVSTGNEKLIEFQGGINMKNIKEVMVWFAWVLFGVLVLKMDFDAIKLAISLVVGLFTGVGFLTWVMMFTKMLLLFLGATVGGIILKTVLDGKTF